MSAFDLRSSEKRARARLAERQHAGPTKRGAASSAPMPRFTVSDLPRATTGLLATKAHAILDRGTRRDFFDLYVLLETQRLGLSDVLRALSAVYEQPVHQGLFRRAVGYLDDAAAKALLPGEGKADFQLVQAFFSRAVGALVVPPSSGLEIQARRGDQLDDSVAQAAEAGGTVVAPSLVLASRIVDAGHGEWAGRTFSRGC